jgi:O-antigen ligase
VRTTTIKWMPSHAETSTLARFIGWPVAGALLAYTVLLGGTFPGVFAPTFRMANVVIACVTLVIWLALTTVHARWRPASILWPAIAAILVAFVVSTVTSVLPRMSIEYLAYAVVLLALYLLLVRLQAHHFIGARLGAVAPLLLAIIATLYLRETFTLWQGWWSLVGRVTLPPLRPGFESLAFGNPSALGAAAVLLFVSSAAHIGGPSPGRRAVVALLGLLTVIVCLVTGARSVWLGLLGLIAAVAVLWATSAARRETVIAGLRTSRGRFALVAGVAVAAAAAAIAAPGVLLRAGLGDPYRPGYWLASVRMFGDQPVSGQGPGVWAVERARFTATTELDFYIPHGHNVYLQTLAELGLVGALAAIVVAWTVGRLIVRSLAGTAEQRRYAWALIAAIAYLAAHQLIDVVTNLPAILLVLALPVSRLDALALAAQRGSQPHFRSHGVSRVSGIGGAVAVALGLAILAWSTSIAVRHQGAVDVANSGRWNEALQIAREVVAADPGMPPYRVTLGLALARSGDGRLAQRELRDTAEIDELPQVWLDVAALEAAGGRPDAAKEALARALRLGRQQAGVALPATLLYVRLGDHDRAQDALVDAFRAAPSIVADDWWLRQPDMADLRDGAVERILVEGGSVAFRVALETGQLSVAAAVLEAIDESDTTTMRLALGAWAGDEATRAQLEYRALDRPLDIETVAWNAIVAEHLGDAPARDRYRLWAELINGGAGFEAIGYRIVEPLPDRTSPTGTLGLSYGQYLYLRPVPRDELVLGLPQLVYR